MSRSLIRTCLASIALLGVVGCSGSEAPSPSDFAEGTCRAAAEDVLAVDEAASDLGDGPELDRATRDALRAAQERLAALAETAEPGVRERLADLVTSIGAVRIRADGRTYEPSLGAALERAGDRVLGACARGPA